MKARLVNMGSRTQVYLYAHKTEEIARDILKKYDEVIKSVNDPKIKAVAFNYLYDEMGLMMDLLDIYMFNDRDFDNIFKAHGMTYVIQYKNWNFDIWVGNKRNIKKTTSIPKWLIIGKKGINKAKLKQEEIFYYNHLDILMSNKVKFDAFLDESIKNRVDHFDNQIFQSRYAGLLNPVSYFNGVVT